MLKQLKTNIHKMIVHHFTPKTQLANVCSHKHVRLLCKCF